LTDIVGKSWADIKIIALEKANDLPDYKKRLLFEFKEIEKQGAMSKWEEFYNEKKKFDSNPNNLVLPWVLNLLVDCDDPMAGRSDKILNTVRASKVYEYIKKHDHAPSDFVKDPDMPDIDLDCLPKARDPIKEYAMKQYGKDINDGYGPVCSVGTWQTYKLRSAIIDTISAMGFEKSAAWEVTTKLPDEVDDLKDGGKALCKGRIIQNGEESECGHRHPNVKCPKCGSTDTDGPTIAKLFAEHEMLANFAIEYPDVITCAVRIVGRIRNMGMHAGALIIADRSLYGNVPLARSNNKGYWISMWSEGRSPQLSKFGYIKWDILGLKTLQYIFNCCKLIEMNRGISFGDEYLQKSGHSQDLPPAMTGWDDIDPSENRAGHFFDENGVKHDISLNDKFALSLADEQKTDGVFQFDTDLAKSILANGVTNFNDLLFYNAAGHPGPMASIPEAVDNRDNDTGWRKKLKNIHPQLLEILDDTYGIILWQEQLAAIWQNLGGFTAPEAQDARKAVAKKWAHKLRGIEAKWILGASKSIGSDNAKDLWQKMVSFGRYAFNRSHGISYCLVAYRCLWLKAHFAPEWWAAVMSDCHPDKLVRYMGIARSEGWKPTDITRLGNYNSSADVKSVVFDTLNMYNLTSDFTVTGNVVNQGMIGIKGIGESVAEQYEGRIDFTDIDDFIDKKGGKKKTILERFIKLGSFKNVPGHENSKALWTYYQYKYCTGKDITKLKSELREMLLAREGWDSSTINDEIDRQIKEYRNTFPNRRKIPPKITNWKPKPDDSREKIMSLIVDDFTAENILEFEKEYLGYYLHSPLDIYDIEGNCTIENAKEVFENGGSPRIEAVIIDIDFAQTRTHKDYCRLIVSDGVQTALVLIWENELRIQREENLVPGSGVQIPVDYDKSRNSFVLHRGDMILKLLRKGWDKKQCLKD